MNLPGLKITDGLDEMRRHDLPLCYHVMDELRQAAGHCRSGAEAATHLAIKSALNSIAFVCESGVSAVQNCLRMIYPSDESNLEEKTEEAIQSPEDQDNWRPGPDILPED